MSRSSSTGDLVPKDITEMLALQNKISKSRKKRGSSLSRTFSWFKGSKPKRIVSNGQSRSGRLGGWTGECTTFRQAADNHDVSKAGQKQDEQTKLTVHYTASQHYQENVFIEGSRPKYLEDLHTEAQEGLKILQQEEHKIARDLEDDQPVSTITAQQENDVSCEERDGHLRFDSNADQSITSVSTVSAVSSRPVLTRQGSTFKPLNTVKRLDNPRKRSRRTTIMGIPQQVHRELCMGRGALLQLPTDEDDDSSGRVIIPRIDGEVPITNNEGARVHLQDIEALQVSRDDQLLRHHIQAVYRDDFLLNTKSGLQISLRPRSLAVPGITTSSALLQEPQGPVMSISPQATYLSTIIPNAILPSAIDVIEIDRSCNRRSVRTVSKSSLAPASPVSSRSGGGTHDEPNSTGSKWSHSQSSETIVSHPSTISFKGSMPSSHLTDSMKEVTDLNEEQMSLKSSVSWSSSTSKAGSQRLDQGELSDSAETAQNSRLFSRNLSVIKAKLPPAPPRRTYSLHHENLKQRPRELADTKDLKYLGSNCRQPDADLNTKEDPTSSYTENISTLSPVSPLFDDSNLSVTASPHRPVQDSIEAQSESNNSSPQDIFERTLSPSSGYSSQSGTPTHSSKDICPTSPGKQKLKPPKPERAGTRISPAVSVSSSLVSLSSNVSDPANQLTQTHTTQSQPSKISPAVKIKNKVTPPPMATLRELFNIPPPPKVKAPCPPPPETWAHNERTAELLCGPSPNAHRIYELQKHYQTDILLMRNQATADTTNLTSAQGQISVEIETNGTHTENKTPMSEGKDELMPVQEQAPLDEREQVSHVVHKREHENSERLKIEQESPVNSEKLQSADKVNEILLLKEQFVSESGQSGQTDGLPENDFSTPETERTDAEDQCFVKHSTDKEIFKHTPTHNLSVEGPRASGISPPPSPPPQHSPPPPPSKMSSVCSVSVLLQEEELQPETEKELLTLEPSWPPPPPPMDESSDLLFEGQDETDFPPPPPPDMQESFIVMTQHYKVDSSGQGDSVAPEKSPDLSYIDSHTKQNPDPQIIQSTTLVEKTLNESLPVDSIPNVSDDNLFDQIHAKPQSFENVSQICIDLVGSETTVSSEISLKSSKSQDIPLQTLPQETPRPPQHDPLNPSAILPKDLSQQTSHALSADLKIIPPLPMEDQSTVNFKRQPSLISKDSRCKGLSSTQKCAPITKEDANIPLVTPSLLQMVRLRTVNVEDQVNLLSQEVTAGTETTPDQDLSVSNQVTPQKPIRKSCTKSMESPVKSFSASSGPSMRLQEAIRMKTAAMSSSSFPARPSLRLPTPTANSNDVPVLSPKTPDDCKSPASTASFIFSKSTKKVVIETATSPEAQASLKQSLAAELMQISDQHKSVVTNGTKKHHKVPPPVAKKPVYATSPSEKVGTVTTVTIVGSSIKQKNGGANNQQTDRVQPAGQ
ncbi:uncharacterized protein KIAA1522 homolog isoform X1 [Pangasianodon hypophthalmus]|uniref:uncharacterized protein KIAA1522 homolog isoform X1 n=1 Tax=Pangasianodon hypophthalmus TaxID=310915 RepID=UPI0014810D3A|nr:uncharacterized protein KIAA1522 homolog isoform X1 [Pangasianodon hypophthalmus]XP_026785808.2 uncharacterized protein KIAA1522 homolog isoform X1 [Pangasianodon hypophthalmus]XP_026785809.2 uncharacterized protein KIAA1522 homolog isoform X1 [Pangasianodon hypophthalmus]XP_026785810.2 uncharacterized protein KIAA1522 homolog isoform X1 [Pangasianodon hypophthalmus]